MLGQPNVSVHRSRVPQSLSVALGVAALLGCKACFDGVEEDDNQFREDVIQCEEAVARLARCCPDFDASSVLCNYYYRHAQGCGSQTDSVEPALSVPEARCILDASCEALVSKGVCERSEEARPYTRRTISSATSSGTGLREEVDGHPPVCE